MHEISLAEEILRIVEASSDLEGFTQVQKITLEVGQMSGVEPEALAFALTHMASGSLIEGADIQLDLLPGSGYCAVCKARVPMDFALAPCRICGQYPLSSIEGTELRVRNLEVI